MRTILELIEEKVAENAVRPGPPGRRRGPGATSSRRRAGRLRPTTCRTSRSIVVDDPKRPGSDREHRASDLRDLHPRELPAALLLGRGAPQEEDRHSGDDVSAGLEKPGLQAGRTSPTKRPPPCGRPAAGKPRPARRGLRPRQKGARLRRRLPGDHQPRLRHGEHVACSRVHGDRHADRQLAQFGPRSEERSSASRTIWSSPSRVGSATRSPSRQRTCGCAVTWRTSPTTTGSDPTAARPSECFYSPSAASTTSAAPPGSASGSASSSSSARLWVCRSGTSGRNSTTARPTTPMTVETTNRLLMA